MDMEYLQNDSTFTVFELQEMNSFVNVSQARKFCLCFDACLQICVAFCCNNVRDQYMCEYVFFVI